MEGVVDRGGGGWDSEEVHTFFPMPLHELAIDTFDAVVDVSLSYDVELLSKWLHLNVCGEQYSEQHWFDVEHFHYSHKMDGQWIRTMSPRFTAPQA